MAEGGPPDISLSTGSEVLYETGAPPCPDDAATGSDTLSDTTGMSCRDDESLLTGSEACFDIECDPCGSEEKHVEAEGYCKECCEYMCGPCVSHHKKLKVSKHHTVLGKEDLPMKQIPPPTSGVCTETCQIHNDKIISYFCAPHNDICCSDCVTLKHRSCNVAYIPEYVTGLEDSNCLKQYMTKVKGLIQTANDTAKLAIENKSKSSGCLSKALEDIESFQEELLVAFNSEVSDTKEYSKEINSQDMERMDKLANKSNRYLEKLQPMLSDIDTMLDNKQLYKIFIAMKTNEQSLTMMQEKLDNMRGVQPKLHTFQPNDDLLQMARREGGLGRFVVDDPVEKETTAIQAIQGISETDQTEVNNVPRDMQNSQATYLTEVNVMSSSSIKSCSISGIAVVPTGKLVAADYNNKSVKLVDIAGNTIASELKLDVPPWDVTVSGKYILTTLPHAKKVLLLKYENGLEEERFFSVSGWCRGIASHGDKLFVTYDREPKLEIMTMRGLVLQTIETDDQCVQLFQQPTYIAVSSASRTIYVSEWKQGKLKILDMDGHMKSVYEGGELESPRQVAIDRGGFVYLCDKINASIHLLSPEGTKVKLLLTNEDGMYCPCAVCYCDQTDQLYVSMAGSDVIKVYHVA